MGAKEYSPGMVVGSSWWYAPGTRNSADGSGADAVPEAAQLSLDAHHTPVSVLDGESDDQLGDLVGQRRTPAGLGWAHFRATRRRCQRSSVPGVTIRCARRTLGSSRDNVASTARSLQATRGLGFARRSTDTSWRSASSSASFDACVRASSASQDSIVTASRKIRPIDTITHHRRPELVAEFQEYYSHAAARRPDRPRWTVVKAA